MKRDLLDILACPTCKTFPLELKAEQEEGSEIVKGTLTCPKCKAVYLIDGSIPNMIPKKQAIS
jgi:uncharacterized protein